MKKYRMVCGVLRGVLLVGFTANLGAAGDRQLGTDNRSDEDFGSHGIHRLVIVNDASRHYGHSPLDFPRKRRMRIGTPLVRGTSKETGEKFYRSLERFLVFKLPPIKKVFPDRGLDLLPDLTQHAGSVQMDERKIASWGKPKIMYLESYPPIKEVFRSYGLSPLGSPLRSGRQIVTPIARGSSIEPMGDEIESSGDETSLGEATKLRTKIGHIKRRTPKSDAEILSVCKPSELLALIRELLGERGYKISDFGEFVGVFFDTFCDLDGRYLKRHVGRVEREVFGIINHKDNLETVRDFIQDNFRDIYMFGIQLAIDGEDKINAEAVLNKFSVSDASVAGKTTSRKPRPKAKRSRVDEQRPDDDETSPDNDEDTSSDGDDTSSAEDFS